MPRRGKGRIYQRRSPRHADGSRTVFAGHWVQFAGHREAAGCACRTGAKPCEISDDLLLRRRQAKDRAPLIATEERLTVNDALDAYALHLRDSGARTPETRVVARLKPIRALLGELRVLTLRPADFATYRTARTAMAAERGRPVTQGTFSLEMGTLRAAIQRLRVEGRMLHVPHVPVPPQGPPRAGFLEPEVFARMLPLIGVSRPTAAPELYRAMAEFAYATGRRYGEVAGLRWEWVHLRDAEIRWPEDAIKNGRRLTLALEGRALEIIRARHERRRLDSPYVFHRSGARVEEALRRHVRAAAMAIGLHITPHDFRRSAVRNLMRAGVDRVVAMSISGHRSDSVFDRYNITSTTDQRRALQAAEAYAADRVAGSNVVALVK